jgi:hypothetical protein
LDPSHVPLAIETFNNANGGNAFFKAISHPLAAEKAQLLLQDLKRRGDVAIYDPLNQASAFSQFYDLTSLPLADYFIQDIEHQGNAFNGHAARLVTELNRSKARQLFIAAFDANKFLAHIRHLLPPDIEVTSFDTLRLAESMLTNANRYLSVINFATNFVFFRDGGGHHTRLTTANYWGGYGAKEAALWCRLYDQQGKVLADWHERLGPAHSVVVLDSHEIRSRFGLPEFTGQLFIHAIGIAGHDVVKYALDTYGDGNHILSSTHDANSWPADLYAGLPAPDDGEEVVLWVQNSHPIAIPSNEIRVNRMGGKEIARLSPAIPPFATHGLNVGEMLPSIRWPAQFEVAAGKYFVRPRYEVFKKDGRQRLAHMNVERTDLKPDPKLSTLGNVLGKGYILAAPVLPVDRFSSLILPTPMATEQRNLALAALVYDASGKLASEHHFGNLPRDHATVFDVGLHLEKTGTKLANGYGHIELIYDFGVGKEADGWLHGLFRYVDHKSGHIAESSFGSHIFNTVLTYKNEPQNYSAPPPGLSTRLFLRLGPEPYDTFCHLIYPASTPWHERSATALILFDCNAKEVAQVPAAISCSGSYLWRVSEAFSEPQRSAAGKDGYVIVRDRTCRLFGYHGLMRDNQAFSLDHMFGF